MTAPAIPSINATELVILMAASVESGALVAVAGLVSTVEWVFAEVGGDVVIVRGRLDVLQTH
jgi:hypothetical protein